MRTIHQNQCSYKLIVQNEKKEKKKNNQNWKILVLNIA